MAASDTPGMRFARIGLWLIPLYGALLALGTITHTPDYDIDSQGYVSRAGSAGDQHATETTMDTRGLEPASRVSP